MMAPIMMTVVQMHPCTVQTSAQEYMSPDSAKEPRHLTTGNSTTTALSTRGLDTVSVIIMNATVATAEAIILEGHAAVVAVRRTVGLAVLTGRVVTVTVVLSTTLLPALVNLTEHVDMTHGN